jgi:spermidine synthase
MSRLFEELDRRPTPMGEISLRRRLEPTLQVDVYEAMLGEEHLMSSLFTAAEIALADLALPQVAGDGLQVVVGGLGLGYTAVAALGDPRVAAVHVVEALPEVVAWHRRRLLPAAEALVDDPRCHLVHGDFFALVAGEEPFGPGAPDRLHAVLLDIDHTPRHLLHPSHAPFYTADGLERLAQRLVPGGVFGLWSDDPPDADFVAVLEEVLTAVHAHIVTFPNHHTGELASNTVYTAVRAATGN